MHSTAASQRLVHDHSRRGPSGEAIDRCVPNRKFALRVSGLQRDRAKAPTLPFGFSFRNSGVLFVTPIWKSDGTSMSTPTYCAAMSALLAFLLPGYVYSFNLGCVMVRLPRPPQCIAQIQWAMLYLCSFCGNRQMDSMSNTKAVQKLGMGAQRRVARLEPTAVAIVRDSHCSLRCSPNMLKKPRNTKDQRNSRMLHTSLGAGPCCL
jgi:hypothetical protein